MEENREQEQELMTPTELCAYLRCGRTKVNRLLRLREVESFKSNHLRLIRRVDAERYVEERMQQARAARAAK